MQIKMSPSLEEMQQWVERSENQWIEEFKTFLRFASISSEPEFAPSVRACAEWLVNYIQEIGFRVELWEAGGHPIIFAEETSHGKKRPTLLIYHHFDVQPCDPMEEWHSLPFQPRVTDGQVYARGAQDNKGQCFYTLQALKMLKELTGQLPVNIKLCIEGEEEVGSSSLHRLMEEKAQKLKADYLAIVDLGLQDPSIPAVTLGTRGILTLEVEVQGSSIDLHSGSHGGIVPNPIHALVELLGKLRDEEGKIAVPGFYDEVEALSIHERSQLSFDFDAESYYQQTGARATGGEKKYAPLERAWIRPTLEINGLSGGYTGRGFKTVIPAKAQAKISCRLVPHQDPKKIGELISLYLEANSPEGVLVKTTLHPGVGKAVRVAKEALVVQAFSMAFEEVFAKPCRFILEGASIPIVPELASASQADTIMLGLGLATDQIHAPNEHFGIDRLKQGMLVMARAMQRLAGSLPKPPAARE